MSNLDKKQKIIIGALATIVVLAICYYVYSKDGGDLFIKQEDELEVEEKQNDNKEEKNEQDYINTMMIVHVSGAVNKEGIVELKPNSRVADAIDKAGGLREDANTNKVNLAYILEDGMKIYIPSVNDTEETIEENSTEEGEYITSSDLTNVMSNISVSSSNKTDKVNINTATQTELEELPGIGPSTALKIIQYRNENGKFKDIEDIKSVSGIGDSKYTNIRDLIKTK